MYDRFVIEFDRILPLDGGIGVVAEYHGDAVFGGSGVTYQNRYCGIFLMADGRITHWREFDNPQILAAALQAHFAHGA
jgi:ketosteroid isomerase-like protein